MSHLFEMKATSLLLWYLHCLQKVFEAFGVNPIQRAILCNNLESYLGTIHKLRRQERGEGG